MGVFPKDKYEGEFYKDWCKAVDQAGFDKCDANMLMATVLAVKDDIELNNLKKAAEITNKIFAKYLKDQIISIVDGEKKVKHSKLAEGVEQAASDAKYVAAGDKSNVEICYPAIIQSGGNFSLKFSVESDKNNLHYDQCSSIVSALGFRYKNYCANIVRTMLVVPTDEMQANYNALLELEEALVDGLRDAVKLSDLYEKIKQKCAAKRPELVDKLTANFGFLIGIEFREPNYLIAAKSHAVAKAGMVFQVSIGFSDLVNPQAKKDEAKTYALFIGDTVQVNKVITRSLLLCLFCVFFLIAKMNNVFSYSKDEAATLFTQSKKKMENVAIFLDVSINDDTRVARWL